MSKKKKAIEWDCSKLFEKSKDLAKELLSSDWKLRALADDFLSLHPEKEYNLEIFFAYLRDREKKGFSYLYNY